MSAAPATRKRSTRATPATEPARPLLFKVLDRDGRSCHGGDLQWPLPDRDQPGAWTEVTGEIVLCQVGLHLTTDPAAWMVPEGVVYIAEGDGEPVTDGGDKQAFARARLLRLATDAELATHQIYRAGSHQVQQGRAWAWGSATVEAWGSATVEASGSATVRAWGSATVRAWGSATVEASDSATVEASGSATVRAWGSATVEASDSVTVISTPYHSPSAVVALERMAAHVDRRGGTLVLRSAES